MAVNLSPVGGVAAQFFTNSGAVLTGGKIFTYAAGTTTPQASYTTSQGNVAWTNPIVLDAAGRVPGGGEIWLTDGLIYKFILKDANDVLIATYDNISGINSNFVAFVNQQEIVTATAGQTVFNLGISYQPGTNSLSVFVDGVNQYGPGAQYSYVETDSNTVTFNAGLHVGAEVKFTTTQQQGAGAVDASQVTYDPPFTGSVATNVEAKLAQTVSVTDFGASPSASASVNTAAFQAAIDSSQNAIIFVPAGTYQISGTLNVTKPGKLIIRGDGAFNADRKGSRLEYTGTGTLFECGVADGNPDSTGFTGDVRLERLAIVTSTGAVGAKFTNCVYVTVKECAFLGWTDKVVWLNGGNVIVKILDSELFGSGNAATPAPYALYNGNYQFGNFDTRIERCHISNCGTIAKLGPGRGYHFNDCTIDGAGLTGFDCDGYRPTIFDCQNNYFENVAGQFFTNGTAQPGFLEFTFCNNEVWPSAPVTVFGDLTSVGRCVFTNNFIPDAAVKASQTWLGLGSVYSSTAVLSSKASIARLPYINKEYEDNLAYAMQSSGDLLGQAGYFQKVVSGAPSGWTNTAAYSTWTNGTANVLGGSVCELIIGGTEFDIASRTVSFTPLDITATSTFIVAMSGQGWLAFKANSTAVIDTASANWSTQYATFTIPAGATSFTAKISTNSTNVQIGEIRIWQIGSNDFTELGTLGNSLYKAALRNMKRGTY